MTTPYADVIENPPFVALDGGRWFVMQNIDYCDAEGNWGMTTAYLGNPWGYEYQDHAFKALDEILATAMRAFHRAAVVYAEV